MKQEHIGFYIPSHPPAHRYSMFPSFLLGKACDDIKAPPDTICQGVQDICKTIFALAKSTGRAAELLDMVNDIFMSTEYFANFMLLCIDIENMFISL